MKRLKRRYLALQLEAETMPGEREFLDAVWAAVTRLYGEYGASLANLVLINYDVERKVAVLRVNLGALSNVRVALASVTVLGGRGAAVHVVAVSGTIKGLRGQLGF